MSFQLIFFLDFDETKDFTVINVNYRDNLNISIGTDQRGLWFLERENHFPRSHPISEGNLLQLKTVTEKHGGYYYSCVLINNSYNCGLVKSEVRVFSKLLSKCHAMHS